MAKDIQDRVGQVLGSDSARQLIGTAVSELLKGVGKNDSGASARSNGAVKGSGGLSGVRGIAAGAGAAALAPVAAKGVGKLLKGNGVDALAHGPKKLAEGAASKVGDTVSGKAKEKLDEAGGPSSILKDTVKSALPFGGGGGGGKNDAQGVGKGRRMPIQQSVDVGLPIENVYNQWTQFEEWPKFMHRVKRVSQEDPCKVSFTVKIWGKTKEFTAEIETQRPDDRIRWKTTQGMNLNGVVVFRELGPNLTRILLSFDVDPGSLIEKYARGARYIKRAARADLHRFVAFTEMLENETGAWRGVIEDGEVIEDHDPKYDKKREYGSADELVGSQDNDDEEESDDDSDEDEQRGRNGGEPKPQRRRSSGSGTRASSRSSSSRTTGRSSSGRGSGGRSSGGRSSSGRSSSSGGSGRSSSSRSGSSRSSGSRSSSGRSSSGSSSSGRSSSGSSSSGRSRSSGSSSSGRSRSGTSRSSRSSNGQHQGRQRTRSSRGSGS